MRSEFIERLELLVEEKLIESLHDQHAILNQSSEEFQDLLDFELERMAEKLFKFLTKD